MAVEAGLRWLLVADVVSSRADQIRYVFWLSAVSVEKRLFFDSEFVRNV